MRAPPSSTRSANDRPTVNGSSSLRLRAVIRGAVQGVGFRPFIHRLAGRFGLNGWVNNSPQGVFLEVEGPRETLLQFLRCLETEKPPHSSIQSIKSSWLETAGYANFAIRPSEETGGKTTLVLPDIATCPECLREILDPANRRYRYPFTNCTHCGPRFSIIESIPYDRPNTSMKSFTMCPECRAEYDDPRDRRFHAQPIACPVCGPQLELWTPTGEIVLSGDNALRAAAIALRRGKIVAVKSLGGFQLLAAAHNDETILRLRNRKQRKGKPFALMFPTLESVQEACEVSPLEEELLTSPEAPIVLLKRRADCKRELSDWIAPGNPCLGVMLPYTPMHHLLLADLGFPVVATSGNLKDEPIAFSETEALQRLGQIADLFLVHNRPIVRHVDDSIVRIMAGREMILRRARGYAPLPISINSVNRDSNAGATLAVGAHLKSAVAFSRGKDVFVSQHISDLETEQAFRAFRNIILDFQKFYEKKPGIVAADTHPDYLSTRFAQQRTQSGNPRLVMVQHHVAHVLSCMAENDLMPPALGVAWDGTGCGEDGTIWGGEFFKVAGDGIERMAHLRPFRLPGGELAVKEPRRSAAGLLYELFGHEAFEKQASRLNFSPREISALRTMLDRRLNSPLCSSAGRLFDAVAALTGVRQFTEFEGQAAMDLEFALEKVKTEEAYPLRVVRGKTSSPAVFDWSPLVEAILRDRERGVPPGEISARFHNAMAEGIVAVAHLAGQPRIALSGGCFQNRYLLERTILRLRNEGFQPSWHRRVPTNDGGIALGQIVAAWWKGD